MSDRFRLTVRVLRDRTGLGATRPQSNRTHLDAAIAWLCHAQDVTKAGGMRDDGVAQTFLVKSRRWAASYPETTGYIIPTFYRYYRLTGNRDVRRRAVRMADWECEVQHPSGGVLAGALGDSDQPTIFNTGQVLFGWVRAFEEEGNEAYRAAAVRAAQWLCDQQDEDGCWRRFASPMTATKISVYNTRTAWGLARAHAVTGIKQFRAAAMRNVDWALAQQQPNGWFSHNCLTDATQPYTHTIAYAMRGILEVGDQFGEERYIAAARKVADAMIAAMPADGRLPGRFDADWRPTVRWSCLTGVAQVGIALGRLYQITGEDACRQALRRGNAFLKRTQRLGGDPDQRGGIKGSHPIDGGYHPWQYPNWAAKFFADALMKEDEVFAA
jgi:rhamnogalacturonyl hydrolase YesR